MSINSLEYYLLESLKYSDFSKLSITPEELVQALLIGGRVADNLCVSNTTMRYINKQLFPERQGSQNIIATCLRRLNRKYCRKCKSVLELKFFGKNRSSKDGVMGACLACHAKENKNYYRSDPLAQIARVSKRERNLDRHLTSSEISFIIARDGNKCVQCDITNLDHNIYYGQNLHFDHVIPVSKNGKTEINNIQLLCRTCNLSKGIK